MPTDRPEPLSPGPDLPMLLDPNYGPQPVNWDTLWQAPEHVDYILPLLIPAGRLIAIYSAPKLGKSLLMLELAWKISAGARALGQVLDRPRRVLYIDHENDPRSDIKPRLQDMGATPETLDNLFYFSFPAMGKLDNPTGAADLMRLVEAYGCELVVIDTISRAVGGQENDNDTWLNLYRHLGVQLKRAGVACVRLDHSGKDEGKGQRGASAKSGDVDAVWQLSATPKNTNTLRLKCEAARMPVPHEELTLVRHTAPVLHHSLVLDPAVAAQEKRIGDLIDLLDTRGVPAAAGRPTLRDFVKANKVHASTVDLEEVARRRKPNPLVVAIHGGELPGPASGSQATGPARGILRAAPDRPP